MKRKNYEVSIDGCVVKVNHAWNAARRGVPGLLREHVKDFKSLNLIIDHSRRDDFKNFEFGFQVWEGLRIDGSKISVEVKIEKRD